MKQIASLGGGVASTAMILMSLHGDLDPLDYILFADTGAERGTTLATVRKLQAYAAAFDVPLHIVRNKKLPDVATNALDPSSKIGDLPYYTHTDGKTKQLGKYCTGEYKREPIRRFIRNELHAEIQSSAKNPINLWLGYTVDEATRVKKGNRKWEVRRFPLIEKRIYRQYCAEYLTEHGWDTVERSACYICPYRRNDEYLDMPEEEIQKAIEFEKGINERGMITETRSKNTELRLHPSMIPLSERPFEHPDQLEIDVLCEGESCWT